MVLDPEVEIRDHELLNEKQFDTGFGFKLTKTELRKTAQLASKISEQTKSFRKLFSDETGSVIIPQ